MGRKHEVKTEGETVSFHVEAAIRRNADLLWVITDHDRQTHLPNFLQFNNVDCMTWNAINYLHFRHCTPSEPAIM